jgi:hypothetical protein
MLISKSVIRYECIGTGAQSDVAAEVPEIMAPDPVD